MYLILISVVGILFDTNLKMIEYQKKKNAQLLSWAFKLFCNVTNEKEKLVVCLKNRTEFHVEQKQ